MAKIAAAPCKLLACAAVLAAAAEASVDAVSAGPVASGWGTLVCPCTSAVADSVGAVAVASVHLDAGSEDKRVQLLGATLAAARARLGGGRNLRVIVAGDMNAEFKIGSALGAVVSPEDGDADDPFGSGWGDGDELWVSQPGGRCRLLAPTSAWKRGCSTPTLAPSARFPT